MEEHLKKDAKNLFQGRIDNMQQKRVQKRALDGSGMGCGGRMKNDKPCKGNGEGFGKGKGRGKGCNRK
jgi:hypothetical protein